MAKKRKYKTGSAVSAEASPKQKASAGDCRVRVVCGGHGPIKGPKAGRRRKGKGKINATASVGVAFIDLNWPGQGEPGPGPDLLGVRGNKDIAIVLIAAIPAPEADHAAEELASFIGRPVKVLRRHAKPRRGSVFLVPENSEVILEEGRLEIRARSGAGPSSDSDRVVDLKDINLELQHRLDRQAARLSSMLEIAPDAMIAADSNMCITLFNRVAEQLFQYSSSEIMGKNIEILIPQRFLDVHKSHIGNFRRDSRSRLLMNERAEIYGRKKNGDEFPADAAVGRTTVNGEDIFLIIVKEVTKRKRIFDELAAAKEKAESADLVKSEFLANMSHELKTPLNAVIGFSEAMTTEIFGPLSERYKDYANNILQCGRHLQNLMEEILEHARVEAGISRSVPETIRVNDLFDWCMAITSSEARAKSIDVAKKISEVKLTLYADPTMARQIVLNLLTNAIKFTPEKGRITLGAKFDADQTLLWVRDSGIGIAKRNYRLVFTPFGQVKPAKIKGSGGSGLGLPLARSLAELNGGSLGFTSEVGKGSIFTVRLPRIKAG